MSDVKAENKGSAPNGATGRMLSRARRQAMSQGGKAGSRQVRMETIIEKAVPTAAPVRAESSAPPKPVSSNDDSRSIGGCGCTHAAERQTLEAVCALVEAEPTALGASASSVRQLCQERRRALSSQGKLAFGQSCKRGPVRRDDKKSNAGSNAINGLSGRAMAQARREELCQSGSGDSSACRLSGRVRATSATPVKVEEGSTLRGNLVTGTQVERSNKVTGIEAGSCRAITGTEYIGAEQYGELCATIPAPAPAKVGSGSTSRGQRVSGTEVGRSVHVTGDEQGACKSVTGNEYLSAEQFESFCASKPPSGPAKVSISATQSGQRVSGTEVGRSTKVTGDEPGACLKLTGSQYYQPDQSGSVCQGSGVPHKVSVMSTVRERPLTGTDVAASASVTGSEYGACVSVTGTEYAGLQQYQACNREPVLMPEKVALSRTWREQPVSGATVEHSPKVTGDEYGGCQPISGTEYIGPGQYAKFCATDRLAASGERVATLRGPAGESITGVGHDTEKKITGSSRGEAQRLSGTPYSDDAKYKVSGTVGMSQHHLTRGPADRAKVAVASAATPVQSNFSVISPARAAQASQLNRITGTASGAQGRITGPVNLAAGLVSGTPEFRYREDSYAAVSVANEPTQAIVPPDRVTGEGREAGFAITGTAWQRGGGITGTEGTSAARRNPTLRGDQRSMVMQVPARKEREHQQVPPSKVTGSSGNATTGSTITYSGGARG
ncbi:MAG: CsoS2 family carboxysome shell protein [Acidobacteriaceae bacterium]